MVTTTTDLFGEPIPPNEPNGAIPPALEVSSEPGVQEYDLIALAAVWADVVKADPSNSVEARIQIRRISEMVLNTYANKR